MGTRFHRVAVQTASPRPATRSVACSKRLAEQPAGRRGLGRARCRLPRAGPRQRRPGLYPKAQTPSTARSDLKPEQNLPGLRRDGCSGERPARLRAACAGATRPARSATSTRRSMRSSTDAYTQLGPAPGPPRRCSGCSTCPPSLPASDPGLLRPGTARRPCRRSPVAATTRLDDAFTPADIGFCRYYLGELAFNGGELAERRPATTGPGLAADPQSTALLQGRAKVAALRGDTAAALTRATPISSPGSRTRSTCRVRRTADQAAAGPARPTEQFALVETLQRLFAANGGTRRPVPRRVRGRPRIAPPRRSAAPAPSGTGARVRWSPTPWPGRCTEPAATPRPCPTPTARWPGAGATLCSSYHRSRDPPRSGRSAGARADAARAGSYNPASTRPSRLRRPTSL